MQVHLIDTVSLKHDAGDEGYVTCGPKMYSLEGPSNMQDFLSISDNVITLRSTKATDENSTPYMIILTASLTSGYGGSLTTTFLV